MADFFLLALRRFAESYAEVFGSRAADASPSEIEAERSAQTAPEVIIPQAVPILAAATQLVMSVMPNVEAAPYGLKPTCLVTSGQAPSTHRTLLAPHPLLQSSNSTGTRHLKIPTHALR